jgi:hypothetical protein
MEIIFGVTNLGYKTGEKLEGGGRLKKGQKKRLTGMRSASYADVVIR